jgi:hypothetical protein
MMPKLFEGFSNRSGGRDSIGKQKNLENIKTVFVKIKFSDFTSTTVEGPFDSNSDFITPENFLKLLKKGIQRKHMPVRLIGIGVRFKSKPKSKHLVDERQLTLF